MCLISYVETQYISTSVGIKTPSQKFCFHPHFCKNNEDPNTAATRTPTTLLPMSANKEAACAAGMLCQAPDHADINSSMHCCLNCRGEIHSAMWCGKNWGNYIMSANCRITLDQLTAAGRATIHDSDHKLITICNVTFGQADSRHACILNDEDDCFYH
jgi:hypothetical protein